MSFLLLLYIGLICIYHSCPHKVQPSYRVRGPACPSCKTQIRPWHNLRYTEYVVLLLNLSQSYLYKSRYCSIHLKTRFVQYSNPHRSPLRVFSFYIDCLNCVVLPDKTNLENISILKYSFGTISIGNFIQWSLSETSDGNK